MGQVNIRMTDERLALIDRAAAIRGVTRTEFVLRSSEAAAIETLNERPSLRWTTRLTTPLLPRSMHGSNRTTA